LRRSRLGKGGVNLARATTCDFRYRGVFEYVLSITISFLTLACLMPVDVLSVIRSNNKIDLHEILARICDTATRLSCRTLNEQSSRMGLKRADINHQNDAQESLVRYSLSCRTLKIL
jgi:hypothetical protein